MHYQSHIQSQHSALTAAVLIPIQRRVLLYKGTEQLTYSRPGEGRPKGLQRNSYRKCLPQGHTLAYMYQKRGGGRFNLLERRY
jgi:hypothetical protein